MDFNDETSFLSSQTSSIIETNTEQTKQEDKNMYLGFGGNSNKSCQSVSSNVTSNPTDITSNPTDVTSNPTDASSNVTSNPTDAKLCNFIGHIYFI